jgi:hypothetical protein
MKNTLMRGLRKKKIQARMKEIWGKPQHQVLHTSAPQIKVIAQKIERKY